MTKSLLKILVVFIVLVILLVCCCTFFLFIASTLPQGDYGKDISTTVVENGDITETVAIIPVEGVITNQQQIDIWGEKTPSMAENIVSKIDMAQNDSNVKAVVLQVNSPGGEVFATKLIYNKLKEFKSTGKTLVVQMKDMAASGGYYVSVPADKIIASNITTTGSIGVIVSGVDYEGLYEKLGITEYNVVNSQGNLKVLENLKDKNSESYKVLQSILDDVYDDFVNNVAEGRHMSKYQVTTLADGRIYSGKQAQENGLIDILGEFDTVKQTTEDLANLTNPHYVTYKVRTSPFSLYGLSLKKILFPELSTLETKTPGITLQYLLKI